MRLGYQYYCYFGKLIRVVDGDTIDLEVDLGFNVHIKERFRLIDVDCPETRGEFSEYGEICKQRVIKAFEEHSETVRITSYRNKPDSFGRWIAAIDFKAKGEPWFSKDANIKYTSLIYDILVGEGYGVLWDGRKNPPKPWANWETYPKPEPDYVKY